MALFGWPEERGVSRSGTPLAVKCQCITHARIAQNTVLVTLRFRECGRLESGGAGNVARNRCTTGRPCWMLMADPRPIYHTHTTAQEIVSVSHASCVIPLGLPDQPERAYLPSVPGGVAIEPCGFFSWHMKPQSASLLPAKEFGVTSAEPAWLRLDCSR